MNYPSTAHRGTQGAGRQAWRLSPIGLAICLLGLHGATRALPQGGQVVQGQAGIQTKTPGQMDIHQSSDKAIINWQGFSIQQGEVVRVQQPGAGSVLLNRVTGVDPSLIEGQLQANGQVFLLNPRGLVFGKGSQIDAGGFLASTLGLSDPQFMAGHYALSAGEQTPGALQADGRISAPGGTVALVAPQLSVGGRIAARRVGLAAAGRALVDVEGDGLVLFNVRADQLDTRLNFTGTVQTDGGSAELRAQARASFADTVLNMDGVVQARALGRREGRIVVDGGTTGITQVSGTLDASGQNAGEQGGSIAVLGQNVGLFDHALLDASGTAGGGTVLVGGNFHGAGPEHNAERTYVSSDASLRADALTLGNGGQVAVWSDQRTDVYGHISARGGALGGHGGAVETSGKQTLNMPMGGVDVSAARGRAGSWLMDPNDITIGAAADNRITTTNPFDSTGNVATLSTTTLNAALSSGATVTVTTQSATGGGPTGNGDITVDGTVTPAASNATLNLVAQRNIVFTGNGNITATGANLSVTLKAGTDVGATNTPGTNTSTITQAATSVIDTGGGGLTATAKGDILLSTITAGSLTVNSLGGNISQSTALPAQHLNITGATLLNAGAGAGAGDITLTQATNDFQGALTLTGATVQVSDTNVLTLGTLSTGALTLVSGGALNLGHGSVGGTLSANSNGFAISQGAGGLDVTGASTITAGAGSITLTDAANNFHAAVNLSGAGTQITAANALTLGTLATGNLLANAGGALSLGQGVVAGTLDANSHGGAISQSAALTVSGATSLQAGAGSIMLTDGANDFQGLVNLSNSASAQISNAHALSLGSLATGGLNVTAAGALNLGQGTVTGTLSANSNGGTIGQSTSGVDHLSVSGGTTLNAGTGDINLSQAGNALGGNTSLSGAAIAVKASGTLTVTTLNQTWADKALALQADTLQLPGGAFSIDTGAANLSLRSLVAPMSTTGTLAGQDVTLQGGAGLSLDHAITARGQLTLLSGSGPITQTAALAVAGTTSVNAGSGAITLTQAGNSLAQAVSLSGANTQIAGSGALTLGTLVTGNLDIATLGALNLGHGSVGGTLSANSNGGTIGQSTSGADHLSVSGGTTLNAGTGDINLSQAGNALGGNTSLSGAAIAVKASGTLTVTTLNQTWADKALALQADTLQLPGGAFSIDTGAANLSLRSLVAPMSTTGTLAGQDVTLQGGAGLSLDHAITARGQLTLLSGSGPITQTAALAVAGTTSVNAGSGAITLTQAGNSLAQAVSLSGANTQIASSGALTLGTLATGSLDIATLGALNLGHGSVGGTLSANSNGNPISQAAGGLDVSGASTITAGAGSITLTDAANNFHAAVNLSGAGTQITAANALTLGTLATGNLLANAGGALSLGQGLVAGTLDANSHGGAISQSAALTVSGATSLQAGAGSIMLTDGANDFQGAVSLTGAATQVTDANALTLGTVNTGGLIATSHGALNLGKGTLSATVNVYSNGGAITQSTTLPADNLNISGATVLDAGATGTITLAQASNDFHGAVTLTGAATQLTDANALALNFVNAGDLILTSHGTLNLGRGTLTGTLNANSNGGAIIQAVSLPADHLAVFGATVLDAGSGTITLTRPGNDFLSAVSLTGAATQLTDANALTLGTVNTGHLVLTSGGALGLGQGTVNGNLDANSNGSAITQSTAGSDHLTVSGTTALNAGVGTIGLTQAGNDFQGALSLTGASTQVTDGNALTLGTLNTGDLVLISGGALSLGHGSVAGSLNATSHGNAITQGAGGLTVTGVATVTAGTSTVNLTDAANDFQASVCLTGSALQITNSQALTLGPVNTGSLTATSTGALNLGAGAVTGDLGANSHGGNITQAGALTVGGNTTLAAGSGSITLTNAGNDFQGAVNLSGGSAQLVDANALTLGQLSIGNLGVTAQGALNLGQGAVTGTLTADSQGNAITQARGGLNVSGVTTVTAGTGSITLDQPANQFLATVNLSGGSTQLANAGALTLGTLNTGGLVVAAAGDLNLGSGSVGGALEASSQGSALTQAGDLTVAGITTLTADGHALQVTLNQAANQFAGGVLLAGNNGGVMATATVQSNQALAVTGAASTLNASSGGLLTLGAGQYASLNATAVGGVAQSGALSVSGAATLAANGGVGVAVTLTNAGNDLHAVQLVAQNGGSVGTVRLVDGDGQRADGLQVGGQATDLGITSGGPLTLGAGRYGSLVADTSAHGAAITQSGAITVVGSTLLNSGAGDIDLNLAGNDLNSLGIVATRAASVQDANDLTIVASQASQQLALNAPGTISLAGPVSGTGALVMNGSGTLLIQGSQAYSGGTQALAGTVVLDGAAAQAGNGGTVVLGAGGRLDLRNGATLGNPLLSQGGSLANTVGAGTATGSVTLAADTTLEVAASAAGLTVAGAIGDAGNHHGLALGGGGVLTLAGSNDYSGVTQVHAGTLVAQGSGALPSGSAVVVDSGATLQLAQAQSVGSLAGGGQVDLQGFSLSTGLDNTNTTFSGSLSGSGVLAKLGSGSFTLAGQNTASGATQVQAGSLVLAGGAALADTSAVSVAAGATLQLTASETVGSLAGAGTVDLQNQRLSAGGNHSSTEFSGTFTGSGGLSKQGSGTLTLSGANSYSGETVVQAGALSLAQLHALADTTAVSVSAGATLDLQSDLQVAALAGAGQVLLNSHTLSTGAGGADSQFSGSLSGSGGLVKLGNGNLALSGSNSYTGATTLSAGTLTLSGAAALADQTAVTVASGARLVVAGDETVGSLAGAGDVALTGHGLATGANGSSTRFEGAISGDGGLAKVGLGSLTLGGANTYSGGTQILAGTLRVGDGGTHGQLGSGGVDNRAALVFDRSDAVSVDNAISGGGSLESLQGQLTLTNAANQYTGATTITGGTLATSGAERLPDGSAVHVGVGGRLTLAGNETVASLNADGTVTAAGDIRTAGDQVYAGTLTLTNPQGTQLSAAQITANNAGNQFGPGNLSITAHNAQITAAQDLALGDVSLDHGGQITADRLALNGALVLGGGTLGLTANATPDPAKATLFGNAQVPVVGKALAVAEATVLQGAAGSIDLASGASLNVAATGGGSVLLAQDANRFAGSLSVLSGPQFNTAWQPNVQGTVGVQSMVDVAGSQVAVGGAGIEADMVHIRADQLSTGGTAQIVARLPFDEFLLGTGLSAPSLTLELALAAFQQAGSFGQNGGQEVRVAVGSKDIGGRGDGLNAGFLTIRPKNGAQGATAVFLVGPKVSTQVGGYRFFHDGAGQQTEVPVFYNGVLPMTPQVTGALSSIDGDAEDARRARFQETVRTENVTIRLRAGVIAEVGPGRPATQGSDGARPPEACEPAIGKGLTCP